MGASRQKCRTDTRTPSFSTRRPRRTAKVDDVTCRHGAAGNWLTVVRAAARLGLFTVCHRPATGDSPHERAGKCSAAVLGQGQTRHRGTSMYGEPARPSAAVGLAAGAMSCYYVPHLGLGQTRTRTPPTPERAPVRLRQPSAPVTPPQNDGAERDHDCDVRASRPKSLYPHAETDPMTEDRRGAR